MPNRIDESALPPVAMPRAEIRKIVAGQKALVTGANSGIGRAVAIALGKAGADVVVNYVSNPEQAEEVVGMIRHDGGKAYAQDRTSDGAIARLIGTFGIVGEILFGWQREQHDTGDRRCTAH